MFKLLLKMALLPPELVKSHAKAYMDLASEVGSRYARTLKNRWVMYGLSAATLMLAFILGGMALLLWSTVAVAQSPRVWVLWALPGTCLVISGLCWWRARSLCMPSLLQDIQSQMQLDLQVIRSGETPWPQN